MYKKINIIFISLISILSLFTTTSIASSNQEISFKNKVQQSMAEKLVQGDVAGISVYVDSPKFKNPILIAEGYSDKKNMIKTQPLTKYRIGSITKSFTGMSILILHDRGLLDINDKISKYIEVPYKNIENITIKDALNMTTGLKGYINDLDEDIPQTMENNLFYDFVNNHNTEKIAPSKLVDEAIRITDIYGYDNTKPFHYSNTNYILLGMIIEKVSGMTYEDFVRKNIIEPLSLKNTMIPETSDLPEDIAKGYVDFNEDGIKDDMSKIDPSYVWSAGNIISDVQDIGNWMRSISRGSLISKNTTSYLYKNGANASDSAMYTAGIIIIDEKNIWHNGSVLGYHGDFYFDANTDSVIAILSNSNSENIDVTKEIMELIISEINSIK